MDYDQQIQAALLRQKNANIGFETPQGQMVSGRFVAPNALQYIAAGLRGVSGARDAEMAGQEAQDLQAKKQAAMQGDMNAMITALRGKPAETVQPLTPNDDEGNVNAPVQMPAQAGSMDDFYRVAASSQFPQFQQMGMQGAITSAQQQAQKAQEVGVGFCHRDHGRIFTGENGENGGPRIGREEAQGAQERSRILSPRSRSSDTEQEGDEPKE